MRSLRTLWTFASVGVALLVVVAVAGATPQVASPPVEVSTTNPFAGCPPDGAGINFPDAEVEPWLGVNPTNAATSSASTSRTATRTAARRATVAAVSFDGGTTWTHVAIPTNTRCTGRPFQRASDPWVSFGPDGDAHAMSLVTDPDRRRGGFGANGMVYNRSTNGGLTWEPRSCSIEDDDRPLPQRQELDDRRPERRRLRVRRLGPAAGAARAIANPENVDRAAASRARSASPARRTAATPGSPPARSTRPAPTSRRSATRSSCARRASCSTSSATSPTARTGAVASARSTLSYIVSDDQGEHVDASRPHRRPAADGLFRGDTTVDLEPVRCPDPRQTGACPIRSGDLIPEVAVDPANGRLYAVWQDARFSSSRPAPSSGTASPTASRPTAGRPGRRPIQVNATPPGAASEPPGVHAFGARRRRRHGDGDLLRLPQQHARPGDARHDALGRALPSPRRRTAPTRRAGTRRPRSRRRSTSATAPFARGYFLGDYMGLDFGGGFATAWGSTLGGGPSSIFSNTLTP